MSEALTVKCRRGWGKVVNPLTGDSINVEEPFETNRKTYEALLERYGGFRVLKTEEVDDEGTDEDDAQEESDEDEELTEGETDYASMDYSELSELAQEADTDEINGRSSKDDIIAYFTE